MMSALSTPCAGWVSRRSRHMYMRAAKRRRPHMPNSALSKVILNNAIVPDEWTLVSLPVVEEEVRKQAGKVVIFKLTGEVAATPEQIAGTVIPDSGKAIIPFSVWQARKAELESRLKAGELGIWLESFELVEDLVASIKDINQLPVIAINF